MNRRKTKEETATEKKILIAGNSKFGLAKELAEIYPTATFMSRQSGFDLTAFKDQERAAELALEHDIFINCSALYKFNQTVLLEKVYKKCLDEKHKIYIVNIGSTTDRTKKGTSWLYNAEKKALRDYSNSLGMYGVWEGGPKVSLISLGSLSNVQYKHPERVCLAIERAAGYIKWLIDQPSDICVNELSIDPMQKI
jgi:NADP-dependent 3-hydroxy acid dehydrogenase YdfG